MINFPDSPSTGATHTHGALSWEYDGTKWVSGPSSSGAGDITSLYIVSCFVPGTLVASQNLLHHRFAEDVIIPANFAPYTGYVSQARGGTPAAASTIIAVMKATAAAPNTYTSVGAITITASAYIGTFSTSGVDVAFAVGDTLALVAPATPDASFATFSATLVMHLG